MNENELLEQQENRTIFLDLFDKNVETSFENKSSKFASFFEIQNTLDDTIAILENEDSALKNTKKLDYKVYVADTDPEDELDETTHTFNNTSCGDFHLEMSQSFINQSTMSSKFSFNFSKLKIQEEINKKKLIKKKGGEKSIVIAETMVNDDLDETKDDKEMQSECLPDHVEKKSLKLFQF